MRKNAFIILVAMIVMVSFGTVTSAHAIVEPVTMGLIYGIMAIAISINESKLQDKKVDKLADKGKAEAPAPLTVKMSN